MNELIETILNYYFPADYYRLFLATLSFLLYNVVADFILPVKSTRGRIWSYSTRGAKNPRKILKKIYTFCTRPLARRRFIMKLETMNNWNIKVEVFNFSEHIWFKYIWLFFPISELPSYKRHDRPLFLNYWIILKWFYRDLILILIWSLMWSWFDPTPE